MAEQQEHEEGWPLGLHMRAVLVNGDLMNASLSFNTLLTSSSPSSSDLDTQSTGSFFHDKSITLGSLIGISNILELSRRSTRNGTTDHVRNKKNYKTKTWFLSLCSRLNTDAVSINNNAPSLSHFLEAERRAATTYRRSPVGGYGPDDFSHVLDPNLLFVEGQIAPPRSNFDRKMLSHGIADEPSLLLSCLCGNASH